MNEYVTRDELDEAIDRVYEDIRDTEERLNGRLDRQDNYLIAIIGGILLVFGAVIGSLVLLAAHHP